MLVIYGAGLNACFHIIRLRALGYTGPITVIEFGGWRGGMHISGGLVLTDVGTQADEPGWGLWMVLNQMMADYYSGDVDGDINYAWRFQPYKMEEFLNTMMTAIDADETIVWIYNANLEQVITEVPAPGRRRILSMICDGVEYEGDQFIDASYDGGLARRAGVTGTYGRESAYRFNELNGGVAYADRVTRTYGLVDARGNRYNNCQPLTLIPDGQGDARQQGFNIRNIWSDLESRIAFGPFDRVDGGGGMQAPPRPDGTPYNANDFADVAHEIAQRGLTHLFANDWHLLQPMSTDPSEGSRTDRFRTQAEGFYGINGRDQYQYASEWPTASPARQRYIQAHLYYRQYGALYFIANDSSLTGSAIQTYTRARGLSGLDFQEHYYHQPGIPPLIYVREAWKMLGQKVLTENDFNTQAPAVKESICRSSYFVDRHTIQFVSQIDGVSSYKEGHKDATGYQPTSIPFKCIKPCPGQADNLLVITNGSFSSVIWQPTRMEPTFAMIGEAAAMAVYEAFERNIDLIDVQYSHILPHLVAQGAIV